MSVSRSIWPRIYLCVCPGKPLYNHAGEILDGVDMRAEVGLLSRNILIYGEMENSCYGNNACQFFSHDTYGGHIKVCLCVCVCYSTGPCINYMSVFANVYVWNFQNGFTRSFNQLDSFHTAECRAKIIICSMFKCSLIKRDYSFFLVFLNYDYFSFSQCFSSLPLHLKCLF